MGAGDGLCSLFMRVLVSHGGGPLLAGHRWRWWGVALAIVGVDWGWWWVLTASRVTVCCCM